MPGREEHPQAAELGPKGCLWVRSPAGQQKPPRDPGRAAGQLGKLLFRASSASAASIPQRFIPSGFWMGMLAQTPGGGLKAGLSAGQAAGPPPATGCWGGGGAGVKEAAIYSFSWLLFLFQ